MSDRPFQLNSNKGGNLNSTVVVEAPLRINPDIRKWRYALRSAEDCDNPDRSVLYDIYEETLLDGLVTSVTERIYLRCANSKIVFKVDGQADKDNPISELIQTPKFLQIIKYIVESKWYGHSLIELEFKDKTIKDVHLIPRKNVIPEKGLVVKNVGEQTGISYRDTPYINYLLEVGQKNDLGLLNKATPYTIFKRFGISSWGEYVERYGIPIQVYKFDPNKPNAKAEVVAQAKQQGSSAKIVMPMGTETDIKEVAGGSGSSVFKDYKAANDEELLLIFLLQTMTTKDGSSRSQAEVHKEGGEDELIAGYKLLVEMVLNFQLKPLLAMHGFDTSKGKFTYEKIEKLSKKDLVEILKTLANFGQIPLDYIEKHFGIKLTPNEKKEIQKEQEKQNKEEDKNKDQEEEAQPKKKNRYSLNCDCLHDHNLLQLKLSQKEEDKLLRRVFELKGKARFDSEYFQLLAQGLIDQVNTGWNKSKNIDYNSPDHLTRTLLELNLYRFSATKDLALLQEVNKLLPNAKSFSDFEKQAASILTQYNKNHLKTEYNLAFATAQSTSNYLRNLEVAEDFPYWEYQTAGDDRVRPSHAALDGLLFRAGETGALTMPNGFGCRCEYIPRTSIGNKELVTEEQAIAKLGKEFEVMKKAGFAINRAADGLVFTNDQMYISKFSEEGFSFKDFQLPVYSKILSKVKAAKKVTRNKAQAQEWFKEQANKNGLNNDKMVRFIDYNERPTHLEFKTLLDNKKWNVLDLIPTALKKPNEVYFKRNKTGYTLTYIQYYNPKPLVVELSINNENVLIKSWGFATNINKVRTGLLIKKG